MNKGKQDLEGARLQEMLERSCWKTNNEKNKLDIVLWNTSQIMRWQPATNKIKDWVDINKETRNLFTGRIDEELGSLINTIRATILKGKL